MVDHVFPVLVRDGPSDVSCSEYFDQCNYWSKQPDDINQEEVEDSQSKETS